MAARGPPYFNAGLRISPDFLRIKRAEYGEGIEADCGPEEPVELRGMIPVKSSLSPVSRRLRMAGRSLPVLEAAMMEEAPLADVDGGDPDEVERVLGVYEAE